jgi:dephospho-CoA kinase
MSHAVMAWGRFNPPTEQGHGKLVKAVQDHAEKVGGSHYVFPTHTQDKKKNPLTHSDKVGTMRKLFPGANVVSHDKVRTIMDAMKHLESKGHKEVTVVAGSDRVDQYHKMLNQYRSKEYPKIKKVNVVSAGQRDPDAEGAEGMSASKLRGLVASGNKKEFMKHYSDKKLGAELHDKVKAGMQTESVTPVGIFLLGGPGSGKDYVLKNIFSRFDLTEVQADQILNGSAEELIRENRNIIINGISDANKIAEIEHILEGYSFDFVHVSVTNKVSRLRNEQREQPITETKRIEKYLKAEKLAQQVEAYVFNNSINLNESSEFEKVFFASQIERLLERIVELGLPMLEEAEPKTFMHLREKKFPPVAKDKETGLPKKYVAGLSTSTAKARKAHWEKANKLSDSDPRAYEPAPGDATAKTKPSKHTLAVRKMMGEAGEPVEKGHIERRIARGPNLTVVKQRQKENKAAAEMNEGAADKSLAAKADKSGVSLRTLKAVYRRGVAAWNSGHRPGTTPSQWGHARVNSYINKGKTYHTADKDLREETKITGTNCKNCTSWVKESVKPVDKSELNENGGLKPTSKAYVEMAKRVDLISLPGKATVKEKAFCDYEDVQDFVTERMCCAYWDNKDAKRPFKGVADVMEDTDINQLFEYQLVGTDEYRKHAIAMTPGQNQEIEDAFPVKDPNKKSVAVTDKKGKSIVSQYTEHTNCGTPDCCGECSENSDNGTDNENIRDFRQLRTEAKKKVDDSTVDLTPTFQPKRIKKTIKAPDYTYSDLQGAPVTARFNALESKEPKKDFMPTPRQVTRVLPQGTKVVDGVPQHDVPKGYKRVRDFGAGYKLVKEDLTLEEAVTYHLENKISFTENVFRPGSEMFFNMISEAKRLYAEEKYTPVDEWEKDMLESNIGEKAMFEGQEVILDYPFEEELNEEDKTEGKGIGKPWREGGGGAVYVRDGESIRKIRFSQSGMKKRYMDPAATRSFVARHRCLTNKDKTSASYWACRYPRFFSNSGKIWW